ncbi:lipocalin-1 [Sminthopsis crassicaudata]|uniref:lipocalin-1 n=1 Tax=Sminthopsis crassicaudata TaxID=9301 RepID=UPI003D68019D
MMKNGECKGIKLMLEKTENSNEYNIQRNFEHEHKVHVTKTSVPDNWIFECEGQFHGEHFKVAKLLGPNKEADPQAMEEYLEITKQRNYDESKIIFPKFGGEDKSYPFQNCDIQEIPVVSSDDQQIPISDFSSKPPPTSSNIFFLMLINF